MVDFEARWSVNWWDPVRCLRRGRRRVAGLSQRLDCLFGVPDRRACHHQRRQDRDAALELRATVQAAGVSMCLCFDAWPESPGRGAWPVRGLWGPRAAEVASAVGLAAVEAVVAAVGPGPRCLCKPA